MGNQITKDIHPSLREWTTIKYDDCIVYKKNENDKEGAIVFSDGSYFIGDISYQYAEGYGK